MQFKTNVKFMPRSKYTINTPLQKDRKKAYLTYKNTQENNTLQVNLKQFDVVLT